MPAGVDWEAAEAFYLGLDPGRRSFTKVARQFHVSHTRVGVVARQRGWVDKAAEIDAEAGERARERIVLSREERVRKTLGIVDGMLKRFDSQLEQLELRPSDLPALVKLAELLVGEATDRMSFSEVQEALAVVMSVAVQALREAWPVEQFLADVQGRLGAIGEADAA